MNNNLLAIYFFFCSIILMAQAPPIYTSHAGQVLFQSDAPLELIEARSNELRGAIDPQKSTFAFSIEIGSFQGFNSPLQQVHFNENYLESDKYKTASFKGKIIEKINLQEDGNYAVRAKGKLNVHGVERERIIKSQLEVKNGRLVLESIFTILLQEHEIGIPKIVNQKIAEEILVKVNATFELEKS